MPRLFPRSVAGIALALAAVVAGCTSRGAGKDQQRVVAISKQINEFMYAIGAESVLVARDLTSIYPPEIKQLPSVGYHRALSAEGIISMKPTLLLSDGNVGPDAVLEQVRKVGIPVLTIEPGKSIDSAQALLTRLGKEFHREAAADSVRAKWQADMADLWRDTVRWSHESKPRVLIIHFGQIGNSYLALKRGGAADAILHWAGGENAIDSVGGMARLTPELIARAAPDIIVATDVGFDRFGSAEGFATMPGVALTPAGRSRRIYRIDEQKIMYYGPRTPAAVRELASLFHPDLAQPVAAR